MNDLPNLYHIEIKDKVDGIVYSFDVMAFSLIEAMQRALDSHNDGYSDPPQGMETIITAKMTAEGIYMFTDAFTVWFKENY